MGRLSPMQRVQVIAIYNDLHDLKVLNKCKKVAQIANLITETRRLNYDFYCLIIILIFLNFAKKFEKI